MAKIFAIVPKINFFMNLYERLISVYDTLRDGGQIHTQHDFAVLLEASDTTVSKALKQDPRYLTPSLVKRAEAVLLQEPTPAGEGETTVLVIPYEARGGLIGDFVDGVQEYDCEKVISPIRGADLAMEVTGDSMSPEYPSGSRVLIKKVSETFIAWNETYVLDTPDGAVIKRVRKTDDPAVVECVSVNPAYQSYTIPRDFIRGWYKVLMVMSLK